MGISRTIFTPPTAYRTSPRCKSASERLWSSPVWRRSHATCRCSMSWWRRCPRIFRTGKTTWRTRRTSCRYPPVTRRSASTPASTCSRRSEGCFSFLLSLFRRTTLDLKWELLQNLFLSTLTVVLDLVGGGEGHHPTVDSSIQIHL